VTTAFEISSDHRLVLVRETPARLGFGKPTSARVPFDEWPMQRPAAASAGVARLLAALGDDERARDGAPLIDADAEGATLHPVLVARLSDAEAIGLALPPATRLTLSLQSSGLITRPDFRIDARWTKPGGVPVRATISGATLRHEGRDWRVPEPLFSTLAEVAAVNAALDEAARQAALSRLKRAIGDDVGGQVAPDGQIERLRLSYASGFSLALRASATGFDFDPVLFGRERLDAAEDGAVLDEGDDGLLPPALATGFVRSFRQGDGARRAYLLDDGSLLFLDPELTRAMCVVRQAQRGTPEQRRDFARAPQRAIADALGDGNAGPGLFIETQQFSQRVASVDVWRKPVLPWIKPKSDSWLPERFGLSIGEGVEARTLEIAPDQVERVQAAAQQAVRDNQSSFTFAGEEVPATQSTLAALDSLAALVAAALAPRSHKEDAAPPALAGRYFLQVRDNLEDVGYAPLVPPALASVAPPPDMPIALTTTPKLHQEDGFRWLVGCYLAGLPGALLADDMGLGKTFQALAFLAWLRGQEPHPRPVLIVAPTGLLATWRAEIARHLAPDALGRVVGAYGKGLSAMRDGPGRDIELGDSRIDVEVLGSAGVVLTTYEAMRDYHLSFARLRFSAIVYDEVQKLKNPASQMTRAAKTLNARFQLAMTGTPVENRLQDLWSIFDVIHPGLLGSSRAFETDYPANPERLRALHDRLTLADGGRPPALLRRMKDDCLVGLPAKRIEALPMPMPPAQRAAYDRVIARALAVKGTGERGRMLEVLAALRGVSLHPVAPEEAAGGADYWVDSARLATLFDLLSRIAGAGEKVLIFCESLAMQAMLAAEIARRFALAHPVTRIHGGVSGDARQQAVDVFQTRGPGFDAMILSPKAGGVGLTLTAANHVVHLSRWWNPAVEDQATDRAYRIGQTRDVTVYLPQAVHPDPAVAPTSFDLKLHALMERKRTLSRGLLAPGDDAADADALFDAVVTDAVAAAQTPEPEPVPIVEAASAPVPRRSILGIKRPLAATPTSSPIPTRVAPAWPKRVVYEPNAARDLTIFKAPIAADPVRELIIVDPYACAGSRARQAGTDFAAMMTGDARSLDRVQLVTYDADDVDLRDPESSTAQYDDMQRRWRARFGDRPVLHHQQRSKRQARDLHDREVRSITTGGRTLIWDLGRGIEGVMSNRFGCRVTLTEE